LLVIVAGHDALAYSENQDEGQEWRC